MNACGLVPQGHQALKEVRLSALQPACQDMHDAVMYWNVAKGGFAFALTNSYPPPVFSFVRVSHLQRTEFCPPYSRLSPTPV